MEKFKEFQMAIVEKAIKLAETAESAAEVEALAALSAVVLEAAQVSPL